MQLDFSDLLEGENGDLTFAYSSKGGNRYWNPMKPDAEGAWRLRQAPATALYASPTTRIKNFG